MRFFLPLLGVAVLVVLVIRYFLRQISKENEARYGDGSRIIPGSMQSSQPKAKIIPGITAAEHAQASRDEIVFDQEEEKPAPPVQSRAKKIKGSKADLKRAFMLRWLLDRYDK
ncbi:MAG: hypothetical protein AB8F95_21700 [Bacteroidia bacterium]